MQYNWIGKSKGLEITFKTTGELTSDNNIKDNH